MRKSLLITGLALAILLLLSFSKESLRDIYSRPSSQWPSPKVDASVNWKELGILPETPLAIKNDSLQSLVHLGKLLFFDPRLSSSGTISCATCHQPELSWTDGKERSVGHAGATSKRNAPTIQNSWFYDRLFWDGRAKDLQDQSFAPINSETEMHSDMPSVMHRLRQSRDYPELFRKAFGSEGIDPDRMTWALSVFEKTIVSAPSRFDEFLRGNRRALTNGELRGLHLYRTKAGCMNCHNGPMFSDNQFHANGFSHGDPGLYWVSHREEDRGKFKTPSLRDVLYTGPWMHDGNMKSLLQIIETYRKEASHSEDKLLAQVSLDEGELKDLLAFLKAISAKPLPFARPKLPE